MTHLTIGTSAIREQDGLFSLNDLHKASGGADNHKPAFFLRNDQTKALIEEIQVANSQLALKVTHGGAHGGTYACRELVIAYAAWISPAFHLKVIRVFLSATAPQATQQALPLTAPDTSRLQQAAILSAGIVAEIYRAVLEGKDVWSGTRFMFAISHRADGTPQAFVKPVEEDALIGTVSYLAQVIATPSGASPTNAELVNLAKACADRLAQRMNPSTARH